MKLSQEKGASAIVTTLCLEEGDFYFNRSDWCDIVDMRYMWTPPNLPSHCPCGKPFSMRHSQICPVGGFRDMRHRNVIQTIDKPMKLAHNDVDSDEPVLQPVPDMLKPALLAKYKSVNVSDEARADMRVNSFWGNNRQAFFDIRVFYPFACSNQKQVSQMYKAHVNEKKRKYCQRVIEVDHGTFSPLVCASTGSVDEEFAVVLKVLAHKVAAKTNQRYAHVIGLLRCELSFSLMRSAIRMLRGSRRLRRGHGVNWCKPVDVTVAEARIDV